MRVNKISLMSVILVSIMSIFLIIGTASSDNYPEKPIQAISTFSPGTTTDNVLHLISSLIYPNFLSEPFVVVSMPGAGSSIGLTEVFQSKPDGYTIAGTATSGIAIIPITREVPYSYDDFTPICRLVDYPGLLVTSVDAPWDSLDELIEYSRNNRVLCGTSGAWTLDDLVIKQINNITGTQWEQVPGAYTTYLPATMSRTYDVSMCYGVGGPYVERGDLKALACSGINGSRYSLFPDVPTFKELGFDLFCESNMGLVGPKGLPDAIKDKLVKDIYDVTNTTEYKEATNNNASLIPSWSFSEEYDLFNRNAIQKTKEILMSLGISEEEIKKITKE